MAPHPDDEVLGCGGTLRRLADVGAHVLVVVMGRGDGGVDGTAAVERREAECSAACTLLGAQPPRFLRIPSETLRDDPAAAGAKLTEAVGPGSIDLLLVPAPFERHPTHAACLLAALLGGTRSQSAQVWGWGVWDALPLAPGVVEIDISDVRKEKTRALAAHRSQMEGRALGVGIAGRDMSQAAFSKLTGEESRKAVERLVDLTELATVVPAGATADAAGRAIAAWMTTWTSGWVAGLWGDAPR